MVVRLDDELTGFSPDNPKEGRPYLVVRLIGEPPRLAYVVPRTSTGREGIAVPKRTLPAFDVDGFFLTYPLSVDPADLDDAEELGMLPEPYASYITERLYEGLMEDE